MKINLKTKIISGLFLIVIISIVSNYITTIKIDSIKENLSLVNNFYTPLLKITDKLKSIELIKDPVLIDKSLNDNDEKILNYLYRMISLNSYEHLFEMANDVIKTYNRKTELAVMLNKEINDLKKDYDHLINLIKNYKNEKRDPNHYTQIKQEYLKLKNILNNNISLCQKNIERYMNIALLNAEKEGKMILIILGTLILLTILISIITFLSLSFSIKPLDELLKGVKNISQKNFDYTIKIKEPILSKILPFLKPSFELKELAKAFNEMSNNIKKYTEELRRTERLAAVGKVSAEIAHEIKNPLNSISLNIELLEDEIKDKANLETITNIKKEIERLTNIINNYLTFTKSISIALEEQSLNEIIYSVADLFKQELKLKNIDLKINIPSQNIILKIDKNMFKQALINLIKNSIEALDSITIPNKKIIINVKRHDKNYIISVIDNGPGINKEYIDKIFLPFFTLKPNGNGLGLNITYDIIKRHGGSIYCQSNQNEKTEFNIVLPSN